MPRPWERFGQPALVAGCVVLAGCAAEVPNRVSTDPVAAPVFTAEGIVVGDTGKEIGFGRAQPGAIAAMARLMGSSPAQVAPACAGLVAARWRDGTTLYFEPRAYDPGAFVGWAHDGRQARRTCGS